MTEYIYGGVPITFSDGSEEGKLERREEIVRCKNCKFSEKKAWSFADEEWLVCSKIAFEEVQNDHFCSWGEKVVE